MDNFVVSARKYRPATFSSVVGQSHVTTTLKNAIARNQLAHAYLFCGPRGVGKTTCARIFAKAINCLDPVDSESCGRCESCLGFSQGRSFNIHELDAASNNSVDNIRALTDQVRIPPQIGRYSVYIIDEVHMLTQSAFNAFLKTLEEPPAHAIFILATTEKHKVIPTILSRCQIYDFNRIRPEDGVGYLKHIAAQEGITVDDESLNLIARKADGSMRDALSIFDKAVSFCGSELNFKQVAHTLNVLDYDTYFTMAHLLGEGDYKGALTLFDEVLRNGFSGLTFISGLNSHMRDLLMCKDQGTLPLLEVTGSLLERYKQQSALLDVGFLFNTIGVLSGVDNTFKSATNQRLHVELGLMKICGLGQKKNDLIPLKAELPPLSKTTAATTSSDGNLPKPGDNRTDNDPGKCANAGCLKPVAVPESVDSQSKTMQKSTAIEYDSEPVEKSTSSQRPPMAVENAVPTGCASEQVEKPASTRRHSTATEQPRSVRQMTNSNGMSVTGISINAILNGKAAQKSTEADKTVIETEAADPESEQKIIQAKDEFVEILGKKRPRIATAFETMTVSGNSVAITVASEVLKDDIYGHQKDILGLLRKISYTEGPIELHIELKESPSAVRPIRPEDKLAHLKAKNPLIDELRRELNLEME